MSEPAGRIVAVLDACVLIPRGLRDLLLSCADVGLFRPVWQQRIEEELLHGGMRIMVKRGEAPQAAAAHMRRTIEQMNSAFPDAQLRRRQWTSHEITMTNHIKDRHVLAAAAGAHASHVVTQNLRDFPVSSLPMGVDVVPADTFLLMLLARDEQRVLAAVHAMSARHHSPGHSPLELAHQLEEGNLAAAFGSALAAKLQMETR